MIEQRVQVVSLQGRYALVRAASGAGGCAACGMQQGCAVSSLGKFLRPRGRTWKIENTVAAAVGDEVTVGIPEGLLLTAAFLAYLLPLLSLLAGAALVGSTTTNQSLVALGAGLGLLTGIVFARWQAGRSFARMAPRITARTSP